MVNGTSGSGRQTLTEINVTPLVDVMLVLLIIFMVTAPLIQQGVEVKLPEAKAEPVKAEEEKLILSIKDDRSIWLGTGEQPTRLALDDLEERLRHNARVARDHELYLMADRKLPYGFVVEVMAAVQRAGISNLGMITNPAQAKADANEARHGAEQDEAIP
ncbi:MAG TPA: protein TolR [Anaeromyxobacteraceae bacterium]|nr:protein TolR [Anaeromyxobacteraceae bacterium]